MTTPHPLLARRLAGTGMSVFSEMSALAAEHHAVNLGQGFPDFPGPPWIKAVAEEAIAGDVNQYAVSHGAPALRQALAAFVEFTEQEVTGEVRVRLFKGRAEAVSRRSPRSLYRQDLATFGQGMAYDHQDAEGFIRLFGLPERVRALTREKAGDAARGGTRGEPAGVKR